MTGLRISRDYDVCPVDGVGVFFVGEARQWLSTAPILGDLLPLLDGTRDVDAVLSALSPERRPLAAHALAGLTRAGVVDDFPPPPPPAASPPCVLGAPGFAIVAEDGRDAELLSAALAALGLVADRVPTVPRGAPRLVLVSDCLAPQSEALFRMAADDAAPWIPACLGAARPVFGPLLGSSASVSLTGLRAALSRARPVEAWLEAATGRPFGQPRPCAPGPAAAALAAALAARIAASGVAGAAPPDAILEWDPVAGALRSHRLPPDAPARPPEPPRLDPSLPLKRRSGGYRLHPPETIAGRLDPLVDDLVGPIAAAGPLDAGSGRHVWAATTRVTPRDARPAADAFHGVCLGKGRDAAQARASVLGEAVERLSAHWRDTDDSIIATAADLGPAAIPPETLWQFSTAQFTTRAAWNAATPDPRRHVPEPPGPDTPVAWVRAWSLGADAWRWVPRDYCYANAPEPRCGRFNPNGHAAGGCLEEAILQGFLELVERDAVAIWWYNRLRRPGLPAEAAADPHTRALAAGFAAQGWRTWLLDLTTDLAIPCRAALARADADGRWAIGFGCHFEAALADERAMTELVQLFRADGRDGPPPWTPGSDEAHLFAAGAATAADAPIGGIDTVAGLVDWCRDRVAAAGMDMLVLEQTRPDLGLPVAKVIVPGLRHFWPRFAPGRLYDVPVALGWRPEPLAEAALNPVHLFL